MKVVTVFLLILLITVQCVTPFYPDVQTLKPGLVIDGLVTDQPGRNRVALSFTAEYTQYSLNLLVRGATVVVKDNDGTEVTFTETAPGYYEPLNSNWRGETGKNYTLYIALSDGRRFQSTAETLLPAISIDTAYTEYTEKIKPGTLAYDKGFDVYVDVKDPAATKNYYRWTWVHYAPIVYCDVVTVPACPGCQSSSDFSRNCCETYCWDIIRYFSPINIASDQAVNGNRISRQPVLRAPHASTTIYYVEIEQFSLTEQAYQYLYTLNDLIKNTGGLFDAAPATIRGNIKAVDQENEQVYGLFSASSMVVRPLLIDRSTVSALPNVVYQPPPLPPPGACIPCRESAFRTTKPPRWWRF